MVVSVSCLSFAFVSTKAPFYGLLLIVDERSQMLMRSSCLPEKPKDGLPRQHTALLCFAATDLFALIAFAE